MRSRHHRLQALVTATLLAAVSLPFCNAVTLRAKTIHPRLRLSSAPHTSGVTGRSLLTLPAGQMVVLHVPPNEEHSEPNAPVLVGDPADTDDDGEIVEFSQVQSYRTPEERTVHLTAYNCAAFAFADLPGFRLDDWIEPVASEATFYLVPAEIVLNSYFDQTGEIAIPIGDIEPPADLKTADCRIGDVIAFVAQVGEQTEYVHFGKVEIRDGIMLVVSKVGKGPIIRARLRNYLAEYQGQVNSLRFYRRKTP